MSFESKKLLDDTGWQILQALQKNARIPFAELGRLVGLSAPAVAERVRKMEEAEIITGYYTEINREKLDTPIIAFIRLITSPKYYASIIPMVKELPEVLECHHVTGNDSFILKVAVPSVDDLETLIGQLTQFGEAITSIVLSSPVTKRNIQRV